MLLKLGGSLNDPKILSHMPTLSTLYVILHIISLATSLLRKPLRLHVVLVSKIRPHLRLTLVFLSRNTYPHVSEP